MKYEQLTMFDDSEIKSILPRETNKTSNISDKILEEFGVMQVPFWQCDYEKIYPSLKALIPCENVTFGSWDIEHIIACETICAAICHQINWDFLREKIYKKTCENTKWVLCEYIGSISEAEVFEMLEDYDKPLRIKASERTKILHDLGRYVNNFGSFSCLFFDSDNQLLTQEIISNNILGCGVFSEDPNQKKFQLLQQKLSMYPQFNVLAGYCRPAVDYHLLRCFLRRGLIYPKTKYAAEFILSPEIERKESTVGALRQLCAKLIYEICSYTKLDINTINVIEWHIGRSICTQYNPDCSLKSMDSSWVHAKFDKCPFFENCHAAKHQHNYLELVEPTYNGTSY